MHHTFAAPDGTELAYRVFGEGAPLICLPGGPMLDSAYLDELGGLSAHRRLVRLDLRGTGSSDVPQDPESYRCDRLVEDVEALREHLGLDTVDLLAHSAGANLAALYAARHPQRVGRMALITPSVFAVGIEVTAEMRLLGARRRSHEPWFAGAFAALEAILAGQMTPENWNAIEPFSHGRWDADAQARKAAEDASRNTAAAAGYGAEGAYDPAATRAALDRFDRPVLLLAGKADLGAMPEVVARYAELFQDAELVVQRRAGHFPWRDDPEAFTATVAQFLG
ncbi:alpha/beta fold hydrolase [Streptomyces sp. NBC_01408]|uniref:alpha/beta fold hydrolase n=1 Tax=Streptomyces sp. NBC_01408 TaxID=2903855 RepID=UPI0022585A90|nr:alpha/beta hydrolase [Streptomyces sp. NBC_01408]MCX4696443.1 alpha/beta hydrolase [Streptomyces sp. NBC_01408]